ncbi:unnamed protein product [Diamesa hyperborea]
MGLYRIFSIVTIILLSDIVYETLGNSARCTLHYLHHQEVLDPSECEHKEVFVNTCGKQQCIKGLNETCVSGMDQYGELKHGICKEPLRCNCGVCNGCLTVDGVHTCFARDCRPQKRRPAHESNGHAFNPNNYLTNYDYIN